MRAIPLIRCLPKMSPSSSTHTGSQIATWRRSLCMNTSRLDSDLRLPLTGKMFVSLPVFLSEPGSARYSSAPSITTVWSSYQTSHNDFFEVYITETVTLSPWSFRPIQLFINTSTQVMWPIVLCPHWSKSHLADVRYYIHKYVNVQASIFWTSVKLIIDDHWQWLSFNAKLACNKMPSY